MKHAHFEIGRHFDANRNPLFVVDGKILGTVDQVKALVETYENGRRAAEYMPGLIDRGIGQGVRLLSEDAKNGA